MSVAPLGSSFAFPRAQHRAFLERAADHGAPAVETSTALGAFLVMRAIDQTRGGAPLDALREQLSATAAFVRRLPPTPERDHLTAVLAAADADVVHGGRQVDAVLNDYAAWLEGEMRVTEALDVTDTSLQFGTDDAQNVVGPLLRRARLLRLQARFAEARHVYDIADRVAHTRGDEHAARLSSIGRALVFQKTGNLPASEQLLRDVIETAHDAGDGDAEARACHDLACTLLYMSRGAEAVPWAYRAWRLYADPTARLRALSDTGQILKQLGHLTAATRALETVVAQSSSREVRMRARLELYELRAMLGDRITFERDRRALEDEEGTLSIDERLDLKLKTGIGCAMFGRLDEAVAALETSVMMADRNGLGERLFAAEGMLRAVEACRRDGRPLVHDAGPRESAPGLESTIANIEALAPTP